ncbi:MAG: alkaline phosphatase D family protein [Marinilabiliaceae bacterium]|nr:alkaline phosphatase D family protein [Marinilabiliaceae bacterium]
MKRLMFIVVIFMNLGLMLFSQGFEMKWSGPDRIWIGEDTWANRLQDWKISNDELLCVVSDWNRNLGLLTWRLSEEESDFSFSADVRLINTFRSSRNWFGLRLASKGMFNDYRDDAIFGKGLDVGITANGEIFFDKPSEKYEKNADGIYPYLKEGVSLKIEGSYSDGNYTIKVGVYRLDNQELLTESSYRNIASSALNGSIALVSHFPESESRDDASVAFMNFAGSGAKLACYPDREFGPILFAQHTLSRDILKMSAQLPPMGKGDSRYVSLELGKGDTWKQADESVINPHSRSALLRVEDWDSSRDHKYRLVYKYLRSDGEKDTCYYYGTIKKDPVDKESIRVAAFTGNNDLGFPNNDLWSNVKKQNPDILFFSGDQIYEPVAGYGLQRSPVNMAMLDYLRKWYIFGWEYGDLLRNVPSISIPDDHDVLHGNLWGEGGVISPANGSERERQDFGGYKMPAVFVNMVERTQTSHLPDGWSENVLPSGIGTYYTELQYGGISFAIIEDRKFKSAPQELLPAADIINGWPQNMDFDVKNQADHPDASLLGKEQLDFLDAWSSDWSRGTWMKVLLSATIFNNVATLPTSSTSDAVVPGLTIFGEDEYASDDKMVTDFDSNSWPQTGRNRAVSAIRKGFAVHIAGDQHLGSTIQYGVEEFGDAGFAICVPSISNYWPRRFYPQGGEPLEGEPDYTGNFIDGFGNKMTVYAIANPVFSGKEPSALYDRSTGYGIIDFNRNTREITFANWPRFANPEEGGKPYRGWPLTVNQLDNFGSSEVFYLPEIIISGIDKPVIKVLEAESGALIYSLRIQGNKFRPRVFNNTACNIEVGDPDLNKWELIMNLNPDKKKKGSIKIDF